MSATDTTMSEDELNALLDDLAMPDINEPKAKAETAEEDELAAIAELSTPTAAQPTPAPVVVTTIEADALKPTATAAAKQTDPEVRSILASSVVVEPAPAAAPAPAPPADPVGTPAGPAKLKQFVDADQLKRDLRINPVDLDTAMIEHASLFVHYAEQAVHARAQNDRTKSAFEILEARLDAEIRQRFVDEGKKVTEAQIKAAMTNDARWAAGQARVIEAQSAYKLAEVAVNAFDQRKDLLLEIARDRRKEKEGQLRVNEMQNQRDAVLEMIQKGARAA